MSQHVDTLVLDEPAAAARAAHAVAALRAAGVPADAGPGAIVASLCGNNAAAVAARDAATAHGVIHAPINPRLAAPEIAWLLAHTRPRALLVDRDHAALAATLTAGLAVPLIVLDDHPPSPAPTRGDLRDLYATRAGATLLFTSGTTGRPKGCVRTEPRDAARLAELRASYALATDDVHLITCPLAHSAPGSFLRACRGVGARTVIQSAFRPRAFLDAIAAHRATVFFLVPTQWQRLLALPDEQRARADLSSVRAAIVAGAPITPDAKARIIDWLGPGKLFEFYGSSETGTVTVAGPDDHLAHPGSVGRPPPGVTVTLRDGEVFVDSPALMDGYLRDDGAVDARPGAISVGDLATVDAGGWLTLVDRKHDTIISGGLNVYPAEVERALAEHPDVAGAVAFGVPDADLGQRVAAVVAARPGARLDPAALLAFLRARLAGYKLPRALAVCALDDLPIGSSGKALRRAARDRFAAALVAV